MTGKKKNNKDTEWKEFIFIELSYCAMIGSGINY
jgi:hypothetical protein